MANLFLDFQDRVDVLTKYSSLSQLAVPFEDTFGDKGSFKNAEEALDNYKLILTEIGRVAAEQFTKSAEAIDRKGVHLKDGEVVMPEELLANIKTFTDLGGFVGPVVKAYGGLNLPHAVQTMVVEILAHACPNTALNIAALSMADFVQAAGSEEQKRFYLPKIMSGEYHTSMALTEAGAGSDLGKINSTGTRNGDHFLVNGTKQFITNGGGDITFALVRTDPKSKGLEGLSVVIVHRHWEKKTNYRVTKVEDKICLHGSPTCELVFENSVGFLMGPEGEGFKVMLELMNQARVAMAALAVGIAARAHDEAVQYAKTRMTMGKPIIEHPMVADILYEMELEIKAMRALNTEASNAYDFLRIAEKNGDKKEIRKWKTRYRRLTPLCKYYCSEKAIQIARNAMQIFGGYGVCRDYPVERLLRETLINPIYEGTSQIQSLMVLKDTLKDVATQATGFLGSLAGAWGQSLIEMNPTKSKLLQARHELNQGIKTILMSIIKGKFRADINALKSQKIQSFLKQYSLSLLTKDSDLSLPFLWAERFTRIMCDYYSLKTIADFIPQGDKDRSEYLLEFAELAIPRMHLENQYMVYRQPSTLRYIDRIVALKNK